MAAKRRQGGVVRDGRDGYDVWHGIEQKTPTAKTPTVRPARKSMPSAPMSARGPRDAAPKGRDGFEMFYGIAEKERSQTDPDSHIVNSGEWLKKVKELESQLQAALASGPDAQSAAAGPAAAGVVEAAQGAQATVQQSIQRRQSMPGSICIGAPAGASDIRRSNSDALSDGEGQGDASAGASPSAERSAKEVQVFSVSTPAAPCPPPFLQSPASGGDAAAGAGTRQCPVTAAMPATRSVPRVVAPLDLSKAKAPGDC